MKLSGELAYRIGYDVEHDLFHAQNVFSDEYIKPTFIEYVQALEKENAKVEEIKANADYQLEGRDLEIKELKEKLKELKPYRCINHFNVAEKESSNAVVCYKINNCDNCEYFKEMKREI